MMYISQSEMELKFEGGKGASRPSCLDPDVDPLPQEQPDSIEL